MFEKVFYNLANFAYNRAGVNRNSINSSNYQFLIDKPAWLSLSSPSDYRKAVSENPIINGCINILAKAASNGVKYLTDLKGNEISWHSNKAGVAELRRLFVESPNPLQSVSEFNNQRYYMLFTFGNNYVFLNNPLKGFETDLMTVKTMMNLPSEYVEVKQTGKLYDQVDLSGIVDKYLLTDRSPAREFEVKNIIHFNDIDTSGISNGIMGVSRLEALRMPISNVQNAFEAMNVLLKSRGMQGIIKTGSKDAAGTQIPLMPKIKDEVDKTFKNEYGLLSGQKQFLITYADIEYIKTTMSPKELGIYEDFQNNSMIISNNLGVPFELYKTVTTGSTFENQIQAGRRMYQDTLIPIVSNDDEYWNFRLNTRKYGLVLKTSWDHIPALQGNEKEKAQSLSLNTKSANTAWNDGQITRNQYLEMIGLQGIGIDGEQYKTVQDEQENNEETDQGFEE